MNIKRNSKKVLWFIILSTMVLAFSSNVYAVKADKSVPMLMVSGKVDETRQAPLLKASRHSPHMADAVMAVPVYRGSLDSRSVLNSKTAFLNPGGIFSISLDNDRDWLLVLVNSRASGADRFVAQIAFPTSDPGNTLLLLPATRAVVSRINIGKVIPSGTTALAQRLIDPADFSMTAVQLSSLAAADDQFANVQNLVMNYDPATGVYYFLRPDFRWMGNYAEIQNSFDNPARYAYRSSNFQFDTDSTEVTVDQLCGTTRIAVELVPPAGSTIEAVNPVMPVDDTVPTSYRTYSTASPISNDAGVCSIAADGAVEVSETSNGDFFATNRYGDLSATFGVDLLTDPIPAGSWLYTITGTTRAQFDFVSAVAAPRAPGPDPQNPANTIMNRIAGFVPLIRVNTAPATGQITSIDVQWYEYDAATMGYNEVTDLSHLGSFIASGDIFFDNYTTGVRRYQSISFDPSIPNASGSTINTVMTSPATTWYYGMSGPSSEQVESIGIFYSTAGVGRFFTFQRYVYPDEDPTFILPIPDSEQALVTKGQQFNSCPEVCGYITTMPRLHGGLDFGFDPPAAAPAYYRPIIAPIDGIVSITRNTNVHGYDIAIQYNRTWSTYLAFEPWPRWVTDDSPIVLQQRKEFFVFDNQPVRKGDVLGRLIVSDPEPDSFGPHVHWGVTRVDSSSGVPVCPRDNSSATAQSQVDDIYSRLTGPCGLESTVCLPMPDPSFGCFYGN